MNDYVSIGQAAALIGVAVVTLRRWEKEGKLLSSFRTFGKHRRYKVSDVLLLVSDAEPRINICYSRVSSHDQKADLQRQSEALERYCEEHGLGSDDVRLCMIDGEPRHMMDLIECLEDCWVERYIAVTKQVQVNQAFHSYTKNDHEEKILARKKQ
ncbi:recombinase family protein [Vibrio vulnificus]|nr:recombinase family protein [Vibrio vulnificus]